MRKPQFFYSALNFGSFFKTVDKSDDDKYDFHTIIESYSRFGFFRGNHYYFSFFRSDNLLTAKFKYTNFKRPHCNFCIVFYFDYDIIKKDYSDFKNFCLSNSDFMNGFFYQKNFDSISDFLR